MSVASKRSPDSAAHAGLLRFLSRVLLRELDEDLVRVLRQSEVREILVKADPTITRFLESEWSPADREEAAVEYCRLFIVPGTCLPVASAWLARTGDGKAAAPDNAVAGVIGKLIESLELSLSADLKRLPPDHISVALEIAAWLELEAGAADAREFQSAVLRFLAAPFALRLGQVAEHPVYRAAGRLLSEALNCQN